MAGYKLVFKGLKKFNADLEKFGEETLPDLHLKLQKKIAIELFSRIIEKNPVGNPDLWKSDYKPPGYVGGRSRGNWQISISVPGQDEKDSFEPSTTGAPLSGIQQAEAFSELAKTKFGQTIWIYNNVRYIKRLEDGHSTQAPAGMVKVSIAEIQAGLGL